MNRLQFETSPYLLQHRHNPVDWFAWKPEAFEKARAENRPILVSIGYSTCHWCHVMERESFEDAATAALMNAHFVCIKVDREERPDLDQIYMEACQILTGAGGWPLNCFLTPDGRPFFAGTYWPPRPAHGRPAWQQVLLHIYKVWSEKQATAEQQADQLTAAIRRNDGIFLKNKPHPRPNKPHPLPLPRGEGSDDSSNYSPLPSGEGPGVGFAELENIFYRMREQFDRADGGFGGAPKFPSTMAISFLMGWHFHTQNAEALEHALFSLEKMIGGGIYDQLGGGFARYATDREWLVPHFEKMLYDNALLLVVLADAFKITGRPIFEETIHETVDWLFREMTSPTGGFFSAQDADSEGVEGKFFVWQKAEIESVLGEEAAVFCDFYGVSENGNWEESNILNRPQSFAEFSKTAGLDETQLKTRLADSRQKLLAVRSQRIWPGLDDKIIVGWNGLMISGLCRAFEATGRTDCREAARRALDFIFEKRTVAQIPHLLTSHVSPLAFLEDFACVAAACLDFYEISFENGWLKKAEAIADHVRAHFLDDESGLFFFTSDGQTDLLMRRRDFYDNATPSGNSTMAMNLQRLGLLVGRPDFSEMADRMLDSMREAIENYPMSFERWAAALMNRHFSWKEIAVVGNGAFAKAEQIGQIFLPGRILAASETGRDELPLFEGRATDGEADIFLCENFACRQPVRTVDAFKKLLAPD